MTYTLVQKSPVLTTTATPAVPTLGAGSTQHNLLVLGLAYDTVAARTFTPPAGWVFAVTKYNVTQTEIWYYPDCPSGITAVSTAFTGTGTVSAIVMEFAGGATSSPLDKTGTAQGTGATLAISTSATTTAAHEMAFTAFCWEGSSGSKVTCTPGTGFTQAGNYGDGVKQIDHACFDYELDTGASSGITVTDTVASASASGETGVIATFMLPSAGPAFLPVSPLVISQALKAGAYY